MNNLRERCSTLQYRVVAWALATLRHVARDERGFEGMAWAGIATALTVVVGTAIYAFHGAITTWISNSINTAIGSVG